MQQAFKDILEVLGPKKFMQLTNRHVKLRIFTEIFRSVGVDLFRKIMKSLDETSLSA